MLTDGSILVVVDVITVDVVPADVVVDAVPADVVADAAVDVAVVVA